MAELRTIHYLWRPARAYRAGRTRPVQSIILHSTDGREAGDVATLTGPRVSVHWYVTRVGRVYHFVRNDDTAYHAGKVTADRYSNSASLGIEQEHFDGREDWPREQVEEVSRICAYLIKNYGLSRDAIFSHAQVASPKGRKQDPVDYPWETFFNFLDQKLRYEWRTEQIPE
jgi:N-acetylmuramoyl-L-alanine amidase